MLLYKSLVLATALLSGTASAGRKTDVKNDSGGDTPPWEGEKSGGGSSGGGGNSGTTPAATKGPAFVDGKNSRFIGQYRAAH